MFTGIIAARQHILSIEEKNGNNLFLVETPPGWTFTIGESVNVDGVCSTVIEQSTDGYTVEYMPETLKVATLGESVPGDTVNLERSLTMGDMLSGHIVSGHVDAQGQLTTVVTEGDSHLMTFTHDSPQYLIHKGSVTINGVSLTVIDPTETTFSVAIIPHTWDNTNLSKLSVGSKVNLEYDLFAKYAQQQAHYGTT
jgi:riboflavin synthase